MFSLDDQKAMFHIARNALCELLGIPDAVDVSTTSEALSIQSGAFVTLRNKGNLRGCIGLIISDRPLYETITEMTKSAASRDYRFTPLTADEFNEVDIEISVLTPFKTISDVSEIVIGTHGLFIQQPPHQGLLLPQVATENGWNRESFLNYTCLKAGLSEDAWNDKKTEIQIFSADIFKESDML